MEHMAFLLTMNTVYEWLEIQLISPDQYQEFLNKMYEKYGNDEVRVLYQNKLDNFKDKSVNTMQQGAK